MRKLIAILALSITATAQAHGYHGYRHPVYPSRHYDWVAPLIIGGAVTYAVTRPAPPVVVQQPIPQVPYGYHYENILDANCNCYRLVLVQN